MTPDDRPTPRPRTARPASDESVDPVDVPVPAAAGAAARQQQQQVARRKEATYQLAVRVSGAVDERVSELTQQTGLSKRAVVEQAILLLDPKTLSQ